MNTLIVVALFFVLLILSWPTLLQLIAALRLREGSSDREILKRGPAA
jgi:hypothetical protein